MIELGPAQIHLWQASVAEAAERVLDLLDPEEIRRYRAFRFERDRNLFAVAHAMVRLALSRYAAVDPADWRFVRNEWGKPAIAGPAAHTGLCFNLSHCRNYAACIVGRSPEIGVDVERIDRPASFDAIARRHFAAAEYAWLAALPPAAQTPAFFRIWTLKEAYIKAKGQGLSIPLGSFRFRLDSGGAHLESNLEEDALSWSCRELEPHPECRVAVVARGDFDLRIFDAAQLTSEFTA